MRSKAALCHLPTTLHASPAPEPFTSIDLGALDDVAGGAIAVPDGGTVRESKSNYTWWGMNYEQTHREVLDRDGNVVGTEVHRPGSVWSDRTETTRDGSTTTYQTGTTLGDDRFGGRFNAELSTHRDADGNLRGVTANVDGDAHLRGTPVGDFDARVRADGQLNLGPDGVSARVRGEGDLSVTDPDTGYGLQLRGQFRGEGEIGPNGARYDVGANADLALQQNGEDLASLRLAEAGSRGQVTLDPDGIRASAELHGGALGNRWQVGADGTLNRDGSFDVGANGRYEFGVRGRDGADLFRAGVDGGVRYSQDSEGNGDLTGRLGADVQGGIGPFRGNARVEAEGTAHFNPEGEFQGADGRLTGQGQLRVPGASLDLNGEVRGQFDREGNLTDWSAQGGVKADVLGQRYEGSVETGSNREVDLPQAEPFGPGEVGLPQAEPFGPGEVGLPQTGQLTEFGGANPQLGDLSFPRGELATPEQWGTPQSFDTSLPGLPALDGSSPGDLQFAGSANAFGSEYDAGGNEAPAAPEPSTDTSYESPSAPEPEAPSPSAEVNDPPAEAAE